MSEHEDFDVAEKIDGIVQAHGRQLFVVLVEAAPDRAKMAMLSNQHAVPTDRMATCIAGLVKLAAQLPREAAAKLNAIDPDQAAIFTRVFSAHIAGPDVTQSGTYRLEMRDPGEPEGGGHGG